MHSNYSGYGWNYSPRFVPNHPPFHYPRPAFRRPRIVPHFLQSGNFYNQTEPCPKRQRFEETNEIPQWTERKNYEVKEAGKQKDEDKVPKEHKTDKEHLEEKIEQLKRGTGSTELQVLEVKTRLLEQKREAAGKRETKMQHQMHQLEQKHNDFVISARIKEAALEERINKVEDENSALKKENDALKTEAKEVQKLEHWMDSEKNKHEIWKMEMETQTRTLKDELESVRAANKVIQEQREKKLKTEISEAGKRIEALEEDKKQLRRTKTNSELLVRKLRQDIEDLKTEAENEKQKLERRTEEIKNADKCIREIRSDKQQLKIKMESNQTDLEKKIEDLVEKLKRAESGNERLGKKLEQLRQNGVLESEESQLHEGNADKTEKPKAEESRELESELIKSQESLTLMTQSRDAAVQGGIQLELEHSLKLNQMETDAKERDEHMSLLLSGMTPDEFVAQHQQLTDHQRSTEAKLEKCAEEKKCLRKKYDQLRKRAAQYKQSDTKLTEVQTEKEALSKELQDTVDRLKKETDQTEKLKSEVSKSQTSLKEKTAALEQLQKREIINSQLKKKCEKLENEKTEEVENLQKKLESFELEAEELGKQMADLAADVEPKMQLLAARNKELNEVKHKLTLLKQKHDQKLKPTHEESSQTDPSVQMTQMEVEFLNFLNAKDAQIASLKDKLAKLQQQLEELPGVIKNE